MFLYRARYILAWTIVFSNRFRMVNEMKSTILI
jgi:hypothetical protein